MILKNRQPVTPSQRQLIQLNKKNLTKQPLLKNAIKGKKNSSGRNSYGKITVKHRGGGHKKRYRTLDFFRTTPSTAVVSSIEYDPNRNASIASIFDTSNNEFSYILAPKNLTIGNVVKSGPNAETKVGHSLPLAKVPVGSYIHNVSPKSKRSAQISRAAGTFSKLLEKTLQYAKIELSSGEQRLVSSKCYATLGIVSNEFTFLTRLGKAGQARWLNNRPRVRGVAMNPVDHPHGGGEGKKSGKGSTPWGKSAKNKKTTRSKNKLIVKAKR